jgi:hypothetical protein
MSVGLAEEHAAIRQIGDFDEASARRHDDLYRGLSALDHSR